MEAIASRAAVASRSSAFAGRRVNSSPGSAALPARRAVAVFAGNPLPAKYSSVKPLHDRVLVKMAVSEEKTKGGILLPSTAQKKPTNGEVVDVGFKVHGKMPKGATVAYSKYAGTDLELHGKDHVLLKEEDVLGVLPTPDAVQSMQPLGDRILVRMEAAESATAGGLLLPETSKEKPQVGRVVAAGPGLYDEEKKVTVALEVTAGSTVMFAKFTGSEFEGSDGADYVVLREADVIATLA